MRIAYIVSLFPTLSETFVFREINELRRQGAEVICFSIHRPKAEPLPPDAAHFSAETTYLWPAYPVQFLLALLRFGVLHPVKFFGTLGLYWRRAPRTFAGFKRFTLHFLEGVYFAHLCRQRQVQYLHAHFANGPSSVALAASALSGIPFGFTSHAQDIYADPLMVDLKINRAAIALTISAYNRDYLVTNFPLQNPDHLQVHRVAIDLAHFRPARRPLAPAGEPALILAIGRLVPKKGFIDLIRACAMLAQRHVNFRCWIIGEGPERAALQTAISASRLEKNVNLLGAQTNVKEFLQQADLFVMPCVVDGSGDRDGIPTVLMEAMAMQVPVISTNLTGIPELIEHEQNGLLVSPGNPAELAQAMARLVGNRNLRQALAVRARQTVENERSLVVNTRKLLQKISAVTLTNFQEEETYAWQLFHHFPGSQRGEISGAYDSIRGAADTSAIGMDHR